MEKLIEIKTINHYELPIENILDYEIKDNFTHPILKSLEEVPKDVIIKIEETFGKDKLKDVVFRFSKRHKMVLTFLNNEFASYCFFADKPFKFSLFELKENEIYFYDCFTFEEFRGKGAIYSEVRFVLSQYKDTSYRKAVVEIEDTNEPSKKAFSKLGFKKTKTFTILKLLGFRFVFTSQ